jgi:hypothetical protein
LALPAIPPSVGEFLPCTPCTLHPTLLASSLDGSIQHLTTTQRNPSVKAKKEVIGLAVCGHTEMGDHASERWNSAAAHEGGCAGDASMAANTVTMFAT